MKRGRYFEDETCDVNSECHNSAYGETKPCSFFKLMLSPNTSQSIKLRIPEKFARAYHDVFCTTTTAILRVPTGETREVTLVKEDNNIWFRDGWHNFVDKYSIDYGYFLLFKYEGSMKFNVHIFDLTSCEISYQCDPQSRFPMEIDPCHENRGLKEEDSDDEDEDYDDDSDSDFECLGSPIGSPRDCSDAQVIESDIDDHDDDDYIDNNDGGDGGDCDDQEVKSDDEKSDQSSKTLVVDRKGTSFERLSDWSAPYKELMEALNVTSGIPVPSNSFFLADITAYSLSKGLFLNLPVHVARELIGCKFDGFKFYKLETGDGRQWEVKCLINTSKSMISKGWITFARDIGLKVGDVCVFEVVPSKKNVLKVQVVKSSLIKTAGLM